MSDTIEALEEKPHPAIESWIAERRSPIQCDVLVEFGYPYRYRVNEKAISDAGYVYDINRDWWVLP